MKLVYCIKRWGPTAGMMIVIFLFSSIPAKELPTFAGYDFSIKKGGHMLGYALLGISLLHGLEMPNAKGFLTALFIAIVYAATDEFHQWFVPGRSAWLLDIGIDSLGAMLGLLFILWYQNRRTYLTPST